MPDTNEPRWLVDEMLGRLARYLRFLGYDTVYARGVRDDQILERSREEGRRVITRDHDLSLRSRGSIRLRALDVEDQLRELAQAFPELRRTVSFVRCSLCNGLLVEADRSTPSPPKGVPERIWAAADPVYRCPDCGQAYWEGTHTAEIRRTLETSFAPRTGGEGKVPR